MTMERMCMLGLNFCKLSACSWHEAVEHDCAGLSRRAVYHGSAERCPTAARCMKVMPISGPW